MGSISFGMDFEAGSTRVPSPAAGIIALRTFMGDSLSFSCHGAGIIIVEKLPDDVKKIRRAVFPTPSLLAPEYHYAKRNPFLLPAAWLHRLVDWIRTKDYDRQMGVLRDAIALIN
jgi:hypothetical protein